MAKCRNLGGAIGIALIDTVMFSRGPEHAERVMELVRTDPAAAAGLLGLPVSDMPEAGDAMGLISIMDAVEDASLTLAINEAWAMLAAITALALLLLYVMGPIRPGGAAGAQPKSE